MAAFGFGPAAIARMRAEAGTAAVDQGLAVHPDNIVAVKWFLTLQTQWRTAALSTLERAMIRRTGLDYGVAGETARLSGLEPTPDDFARLRVMEVEALNTWTEEASR